MRLRMKNMSHYEWLEKNLPAFLEKNGFNPEYASSLIQAHGDKCYSVETYFKRNGLHFYHGVAMYLLLSFEPYASQVRQTENGWVDPFEWIVENKDRFAHMLPEISK